MSIEVNGVTLPDIPSDVLEQYPYAVIMYIPPYETDPAGAVYVAAASPIYYGSASLLPTTTDGALVYLETVDAHFGEWTESLATWEYEWTETIQGTAEVFELIPDYWYVLWSNHDILEFISIDTSTGALTTDLWFPSSVSHPSEYSIPHEDVVFLANKARAISGETGTLGFADIKASFDNLYSADGVEFG